MYSVTLRTAILLGIISLPSLNTVNGQETAPYLTFQGRVIPNNSQVQLHDGYGVPINSVQCHTDLVTCCNSTYGSHRGAWLHDLSSNAYESISGEALVSLQILDSGLGEGNYRCEIDTESSVASGGPKEVLYVGRFQGRPVNNVFTSVSVYETEPRLFSLTCRASFAPATFVQWMRDSVEIEGGVTTSITRLVYINTLNTTVEGVYTCRVTTIQYEVFPNLTRERNYTNQNMINITTPLAPTNLTASQDGLTSVLVSWTATGRPSHYIVYYQEQFRQRRFTSVNGNATSISIPDLRSGRTYSISILAKTELESDEVGPVTVTIYGLRVFIFQEPFTGFFGAHLRQAIKLTCLVSLMGRPARTPTISWEGPLSPLPTPTVPEGYINSFPSQFIIDSMNSSYEGEYICSARIDEVPVTVTYSHSIRINYDFESNLSVEPSAQVLNRDPLLLTLTCTTTGGFPENVTWVRESDSAIIEGGTTMISEDFVRYHHSLNVTEEGIYRCTVSNDGPDSANATLNATIPSPPTNFSVSQNGIDSVLVSWTPSKGAQYYTIYYRQHLGQFRAPIQTEADNDSIIISIGSSLPGDPFTFSIVANGALLPSIEVGPLNFTLAIVRVSLRKEQSGLVFLARPLTLFCDVRVFGNLVGNPIFSWDGPGELPSPVENNFTSTLTYDPLNLSQSGEINCTVEFVNFPFPSLDNFNIDPIIPSSLYVPNSVFSSRNAPFYAGTTLNLTCSPNLDPAIDLPVFKRLEWLIGNDSKYRDIVSESTLVFNPLSTSNNTKYRCDIYYRMFGPVFSPNIYLDVKVPPSPDVFLSVPSSGVAGSTVSLRCTVTVVPHLIEQPHVELIGLGDTVLAASNTSLEISHTLDPVLTSYAGQDFVCKAVLDIQVVDIFFESQSNPLAFTVKIPRPTVSLTADPRTENLPSGSSVTLSCVPLFGPEVDSFVNVTITWIGPRGEERYIISHSGIGIEHTSNLTIVDLTEEDEGDYTCIVRIPEEINQFVSGETSIKHISITTFDSNTAEVQLRANSLAMVDSEESLECSVNALPLLSKQTLVELIGPGDQVLISSNTSHNLSITLDPVLASYAGQYYCRATIEVEGLNEPLISQSDNHILTISIPGPNISLSSSASVSIHSFVSLTCNATLYPSSAVFDSVIFNWTGPRITSGREGYAIIQSGMGMSYMSNLVISEVVEEDGGQYTCTVSIQYENEYIISNSVTDFTHLSVIVPQPSLVLSVSPSSTLNTSSPYFTLTCNATLYSLLDAVELTWSGPQVISDSRHSVMEFSSELRYSSILTVTDVEKEDEGEYVCTIRGFDRLGDEISSYESIFLSVTTLDQNNSGSSTILHLSTISMMLLVGLVTSLISF